MQRPRARRLVAALALASFALVLQACREEEQDRALVHDGSYRGKVDQKLDQAQIDALRQRAAEQRI